MGVKVQHFIAATAAAVLLAGEVTLAAPLRLIVNGEDVTKAVSPELTKGTVLVPLRALAEAAGFSVKWDEKTNAVYLEAPSADSSMPRLALLERAMFVQALAPRSPEEAALKWAEGVKTRNGALQYAVLAPELQEATNIRPYMVTGVSSPWVEDYEVEALAQTNDGGSARFRVRCNMWTSSGFFGVEEEEVLVRNYGDRDGWRVAEIRAVAPPEEKQASPDQGPERQTVVPFLTVDKAQETAQGLGAYPVTRAAWDLEAGRLIFPGRHLFEVRAKPAFGSFFFSWDGGERVALIPEKGSDLSFTEPPGSPAEILAGANAAAGLDLVLAPSGRSEILIVRGQRGPETTAELEIRSAAGVKKVPVTPDWDRQVELFRPVAAEWAGAQVKAYFEFTRADSRGELRYGLAEATWSPGGVRWRVIANDLPIFEAGAGTRMAKLGDTIYIATQEAKVLAVDTKSGQVASCPAVDAALAVFARKYAGRTEAATPPDLTAYKDTLIVSWRPPALEEECASGDLLDKIVPMSCTLAVRGGEVRGEIDVARGRLTVRKDGRLTQALWLSCPAKALDWVFPGCN
ncbi:MAG TPA: copper amine oxidase N-terminal domain-containing protein [Firmicutes bacterium]|nr:copper amine oxidase N-terminal domain-containing protein [Bacillota bacterium]